MKLNTLKSVLTTGLIISNVLVLGLAGLASAQGTVANIPIQRVGPGTVGGIVDLARAIVRWVYIIFFIIAVLMILWAAFTYLMAGGDEAKVTEAKNRLIYAVVALAVAFLAVGFETIVGTFLQTPSA